MSGLLFQGHIYNLQCLLRVCPFSIYTPRVVGYSKCWKIRLPVRFLLSARAPLDLMLISLPLPEDPFARAWSGPTAHQSKLIVSFTMSPNNYPLVLPRIRTLSSYNERWGPTAPQDPQEPNCSLLTPVISDPKCTTSLARPWSRSDVLGLCEQEVARTVIKYRAGVWFNMNLTHHAMAAGNWIF